MFVWVCFGWVCGCLLWCCVVGVGLLFVVVFFYFWWCVISGSFNLIGWILGLWSWRDDFCVEPRLRAWSVRGAGVVLPSDLVVLCPTGRGVFLRRRAGVRGVTRAMRAGLDMHEEALGVWRSGVERGWEGLLEAARGVRSVAGLWALSSVVRWLGYRDIVPVRVEPRLPGWAGFREGVPDLVLGPYPVELVSSPPGSVTWGRKRLVVAAYALLLEHAWGSPVDVGFLVSLGSGRVERVCVDDGLRARLLDMVEYIEGVLEEDPGIPLSPGECPEGCPFRSVCWGGRREARSGGARAEPRAQEGPG